MTQRSIQAEGIFGHIKQDYEYERLRRRGKDGVRGNGDFPGGDGP